MFRLPSFGSDTEAQVGFLFHVMIGVNPLGEFRSVKGIGRNVEKAEIPEGGRNHSPHTRVGQARYKECTIEWGMSNKTTLYDWIHAVEAGYGYKRLVWVIQMARDRTPLRIYQLIDAWPIAWEGAELDANNNVVDTEQITIAYEAVMLVTMPDTSFSLPTFSVPEVDWSGSGDLDGDDGEDEKKKQKLGPDLGLSLDYFAVRTDPVRLRFTKDEEEEEDEGDEAGDGEDSEDSEDSEDEDSDDEDKEEDEGDAATVDVPASRPTAPKLRLSGGVLFEPTVFERPTFAEKDTESETTESETGDTTEPETDE